MYMKPAHYTRQLLEKMARHLESLLSHQRPEFTNQPR